jgi:hypothetical protein
MCLQVRNRPATIELWSSGQHTLDSHATDRSAHLTHAQRVGAQCAVRACPLQAGAAIVDKFVGFSPGKQITYSRISQRSVKHLVRKERAKLFSPVMGFVELDSTDGAMNELTEELSLEHRIRQHNNGGRALDIHEPVCCRHQFEDGVRMMCVTTLYLLRNMAHALLCGWQVQGYWDTFINFAKKEFGKDAAIQQ